MISIESSKLIIITREKPAFYNILYERNNLIGKIIVEPWNYSDTVDLFKNRFIETSNESTLKEIHYRLHGHPQYLNLFCILSQNSKPSELLMKLPEAEEDARSYLEHQVYNCLNEHEQILIQIISVYRIPEKIDAFYIDKRLKDVEAILNNLINKFLVNEVGSEKYSVHEIISSYCSKDTKKRKILQNYHINAAKYYLSKDKDPESLLEASYHYIQSGEKEKSTDIIINNSDAFIDKGFWNVIEEPLKEAMVSLRKRKHDRDATSKLGFIHLKFANFYSHRGDLKLALDHANECSECFKWGTKNHKFSLYTTLGDIYKKNGEIDRSLAHFERSLEFAKKNNDEYEIAIANGNIGTIYNTKREYEKALELYSETNKFFEANDFSKNLAIGYSNIAGIYYHLDDLNKARTFIKKAIYIYREMEASYLEASRFIDYSLFYIADPVKQNELDRVLLCLEKNVKILNKTGAIRKETVAYSRIAVIHKIKKNNQLSKEYYEKVKNNLEKIVETDCNLMDEINLCEVYMSLDDFDKAEKIIKNILGTIENSYFYKSIFLVYMSLVLFLNGKDGNAFVIIDELIQRELVLNKKCDWDFTEIMLSIKEKLEYSKYILISDLISFTLNKTKFPLVHLDHVNIMSEETGSQAEVFHPFVGSKKIAKEDIFFINILNTLKKGGVIIDTDSAKIMEVERTSAIMTLGYLYKKGYITVSELSANVLKIALSPSALNKLKTCKTRDKK